jgi:hypothetical protein
MLQYLDSDVVSVGSHSLVTFISLHSALSSHSFDRSVEHPPWPLPPSEVYWTESITFCASSPSPVPHVLIVVTVVVPLLAVPSPHLLLHRSSIGSIFFHALSFSFLVVLHSLTNDPLFSQQNLSHWPCISVFGWRIYYAEWIALLPTIRRRVKASGVRWC